MPQEGISLLNHTNCPIARLGSLKDSSQIVAVP
jgi:hypothetical protein